MVTLELFFDIFGIILCSFWDHFGSFFNSFWYFSNYFWIFLGSFCYHFGIILESLWDCFRTVFEYFHFFWKFWEWSGNNFGILSDCFWIYPAYSQPIFRQNFKILFFLYISLYIPIYIYIYPHGVGGMGASPLNKVVCRCRVGRGRWSSRETTNCRGCQVQRLSTGEPFNMFCLPRPLRDAYIL